MNEMHPLSTSTPFIALGSGMGWFANLFFTALSPALFKVNTVGFRIGYLFAGFNLAAALVVFYFYYESGGFSPEQVVQMYNDRTLKPWKSGSRFPAAVSDSDLELDKVDHKVEHVDYAGVV